MLTVRGALGGVASLVLMLAIFAGSGAASEQSLVTSYHGSFLGGGQSSSGAGKSVSDGIDMLGPAPSIGTVGGAIGTALPTPAESVRKIQLQKERQQHIREEILAAPLPVSDAPAYLKAHNERQYAKTGDPIYLRSWSAPDAEIRAQLAEVYFELQTVDVKTPERQAIKGLGLNALVDADLAFAEGQHEEGVFFYNLGQAAADILVGIDPVTGTLRGVYEATTGINLVTGAKLNDFERGLAIVNVVTLGFGGKVEKGIALFCKAAKGAYGMVYASRAVAQARRIAAVAFGKASVLRIQRDRRAFEILVHASAGPHLRAEQILQYSGMKGSLASKIELRSPELFDLKNGWVYNGHAGTLKSTEVDEIGMIFVGDDFVPFTNSKGDIIGFKSLDGTKGYRPPAPKQKYGVQANFETFAPPGSGRPKELSDVHVTIVD